MTEEEKWWGVCGTFIVEILFFLFVSITTIERITIIIIYGRDSENDEKPHTHKKKNTWIIILHSIYEQHLFLS